MHLQQTANTLGLPSGGIQYGVTGLEMSGVHAHESQLADKRVCHDLEGQPGKRFIIRGPARQFLFQMVRIVAFGRRNIQRRRQEVYDRIEQRLYAFVLESRTAQHRKQFQGNYALA